MSQRRNNRNNQLKRSSNGTSTTPDELGNLVEMFPDWESDDLASLLSEHNNLVEVVIDLIVNNKVSKWEPSRKEVKNKKKDKEEDSNGQTTVVEHKHRPKDPIPKKTVRKRTQNPPSQTSSQPSSHTSTQQSQTPVKREASSTSASAPPGNSWAAALAKDKPKPKTATKETKEVKEEPKEKEPKEQREPKSHNKKTGTKHQPRQETAPEQEKETVVDEPAPVQASSWASAIAPKSKPKPKPKKAAPAASESHLEEQSQAVDEPVVETSEPDVQKEAPVPEPAANVVLPQKAEVDNVGVSFGSLALDESSFEYQQSQQAQQTQQAQQAQQTQQSQQAQQAQPVHTQPVQSQTQSQPVQQSQAQQQPQQQQSQPQQQEELPKQQPHPQYDYYSQFQQQFPQQTTQSMPGAQFVYPGMDYNYTQQSVASPAASHVSAASYQYAQGGQGQPTSQEGNVSTQSPVVNPSVLQQQQQVPAAPYGYPYYNYYYNTPFYGNGAGLQQTGFGAIGANGTGSNAQGVSGSSGSGSGAAAGVASGAGATGGFVNGFGNSQYYQPNQFGNRYPYNYPQQQQPQQPQLQPSQPQQPGQAKDNEQVPSGQPQPQPPMPQYGAYQQYPQYGYQDNSQYRGWY